MAEKEKDEKTEEANDEKKFTKTKKQEENVDENLSEKIESIERVMRKRRKVTRKKMMKNFSLLTMSGRETHGLTKIQAENVLTKV